MTFMVVYRSGRTYSKTVDFRDPEKAMEDIFRDDPYYFHLIDGFQFFDNEEDENPSPMYFINARVFVEVDGTKKIVVTRNEKVRLFRENIFFLEDPYKENIEEALKKINYP